MEGAGIASPGLLDPDGVRGRGSAGLAPVAHIWDWDVLRVVLQVSDRGRVEGEQQGFS